MNFHNNPGIEMQNSYNQPIDQKSLDALLAQLVKKDEQIERLLQLLSPETYQSKDR